MMNCGIYAITNTVTGHKYVGRAVKARERMLQHMSSLRGGRHTNPHFQAAFRQHGEAAFESALLLVCSRADLPVYEAICVNGYRAGEREFGYNIMDVVGGSMTHNAETRAKIGRGVSARPNQRVPKSEETKRKIAATLRGRPGVNLGKKLTPEHRAKLATAKIGNSNASGHVLSPEAKAKISAAAKAQWKNPEFLATYLHPALGKKQTPEHIAKRAASMTGKKRSPEAIAKFIEANTGFRHWRNRAKKPSIQTEDT